MKKLLLSLLMIVGYAALASADEAVFDFQSETYDDMFAEKGKRADNGQAYTSDFSTSEGDVKIDFTSSSGFRLWTNGIRFYKSKSAQMKISVPGNITKVEITGNAKSSFVIEDVFTGEFSNGVYTAEDGTTVSAITFAYNNTKNNYDVTTVTVTYTPSGLEAAGLSYSNSEYTALLGQNNQFPTLENPNNLKVTYTSSNEDVATVAADGKITLVAAGSTTITAASEEGNGFAAGKASYTLTVVKSASTLAEFMTLMPNANDVAYMAGDVQVVYVNGANVYVKDATASSLIYAYNLGYNAGDIIPGGWTGKNGTFHDLFEIVPVGSMPTATEGEAPAFPVYNGQVTLDMVNTVVTLQNVVFDEATAATKTSFTGTMGDQTLTFYNSYTLESVEAGTYTVQGVVSRNYDALQIVPIAFIAPSTYSFQCPTSEQFENIASIVFTTMTGSPLREGETITDIEPGTQYYCMLKTADGYRVTSFMVGEEEALLTNPGGGNQYLATITVNGNITADMIKINTEALAPTVVDTKIYTGTLTVTLFGEDSVTPDTEVKFLTMSDDTYTLLLENFGGEGDDNMGSIEVPGITREGDNLSGHADNIVLMGGSIQATADLTGVIEGEDITINLDVVWASGVEDLGDVHIPVVFTTKSSEEPVQLSFRRKYTDGSKRYYNEISYLVGENTEIQTAYYTADPTAEDYFVTPLQNQWQEEGAYIDLTDKMIEIPVDAENFTMILKGLSGSAINWSQSCVYVDWNGNGSFIDDGETNGVINRDIKPNQTGGGMVMTETGDRDVIDLPADVNIGDTFSMLICLTEPKGVDGTGDLWGISWEWSTEIFNENLCSLINGQAYGLTLKITDSLAAIDNVATDADNAPVEYYNLQGIRVNADQLVPGIYVVRQGNRTAKVLVK